jgi:hypothetical protein
MVKGFNQWTRKGRETYAMAVENQYRALQQNPLSQNDTYIGTTFGANQKSIKFENMPLYNIQIGYYRKGIFGNIPYRLRK